VVIGSGPAGEKGAAAAAYFGKRVALIEKDDHYGGAAANTGTLPSKTLRETALILSGLRQRQIFRLKFGLEGNVRIQDFLSHEPPESLLVVGGGVIGCEYACMFAALGVQVTMIEKRGGLLAGVDREIAESLREQMSDAGMEILLQDEVAEVRNHPALRVPLGQR